MKKFGVIVIIMTICIIIPLGTILGICINEEIVKPTKQKNSLVKNNCDHNWVITSEYSWIRSQYRTISKCSKCGETVK